MPDQRERIPALLRGFAESLARVVPDEEDLLIAAVKSCKELLQAKQSSVWLLDPEGNRLVLRAATGYAALTQDQVGVLPYDLTPDEGQPLGITAWIHVHQQPVSADSYAELRSQDGYRGKFDPELHDYARDGNEPGDSHPCQQFYGGPIYLGRERFGVLKVENKMVPDEHGRLRFSEPDKAALDTVAAMLAMALKHARAGQEAKNQLQAYHYFTLHSIRNELAIAQTAEYLLVGLRERDVVAPQDLKEPLRLLGLGIQGLSFYLDNLLTFLSAEIRPESLDGIEPLDLVEKEVWFLGEVADEGLQIQLICADDEDKTLKVRADTRFLAAAVKELLRNARNAVVQRQEAERRDGVEPSQGAVIVHFGRHGPTDALPEPHLCITVSDNGDATARQKARRTLETAWEEVRDESIGTQTPRKGLAFVHWVMREHGGYVDLKSSDSQTSFHVHLPIVCNASDGRKELQDGQDPRC